MKEVIGSMPSACRLDEKDVLYEVGGGTGKFAMFARLRTRLARVVSVEVNECRHKLAQAMQANVSAAYPKLMTTLEYTLADIGKMNLADATIMHMSPTAWSEDLVHELWSRVIPNSPRLRCVVATANVVPSESNFGLVGGWNSRRVQKAISAWGQLHLVRHVEGWDPRMHAGFYSRAPCTAAKCNASNWIMDGSHVLDYFHGKAASRSHGNRKRDGSI